MRWLRGHRQLPTAEVARIDQDAREALARLDEQRFPVARYNAELDTRWQHHLDVRDETRARNLPFRATIWTGLSVTPGWVAELLVGPVAHLAVTGGTAALSFAVLVAVRVAYRHELSGWGRGYTASAVGAVGWATAAAAFGPAAAPLALSALVGGAAAVGTPWRRGHPLLEPESPALPAPEPRVELPSAGRVEEFAGRWSREVAGEVRR